MRSVPSVSQSPTTRMPGPMIEMTPSLEVGNASSCFAMGTFLLGVVRLNNVIVLHG
jgi:hypothetical protein